MQVLSIGARDMQTWPAWPQGEGSACVESSGRPTITRDARKLSIWQCQIQTEIWLGYVVQPNTKRTIVLWPSCVEVNTIMLPEFSGSIRYSYQEPQTSKDVDLNILHNLARIEMSFSCIQGSLIDDNVKKQLIIAITVWWMMISKIGSSKFFVQHRTTESPFQKKIIRLSAV